MKKKLLSFILILSLLMMAAPNCVYAVNIDKVVINGSCHDQLGRRVSSTATLYSTKDEHLGSVYSGYNNPFFTLECDLPNDCIPEYIIFSSDVDGHMAGGVYYITKEDINHFLNNEPISVSCTVYIDWKFDLTPKNPNDLSEFEVTDITNDEYQNHTYRFFENCDTWEDAKKYCESLGGHLATITSDDENNYLYNMMINAGYSSAYFGLSDSEEEGNWQWVTKEALNYTNWHSGEPNKQNDNEDYALFYWEFNDSTWNDGDFTLNDPNCGRAFICEWDSPQETDSESDDDFPESLTIDYNLDSNFDILTVKDPHATFEVEDQNVAGLETLTQVLGIGETEYNDVSVKVIPKSPGKTVITARLSDGTTKRCNLTVTGIKITLNGEDLEFDQPPINQDGNLLVPIRKIAESMGKEVLWSDEAQTAFIDNTDNALLIPIGETTLYKADEQAYNTWEKVRTNVPSQVINDRTLVPIRQFSEALGAVVDWDDKYSTAKITYNNINSEKMSEELYDAINLNYYIGHYNSNPFSWYTDNVIEPFYNSRNWFQDAVTMGIGKPWSVITDLWRGIYGDTNASIIVQETLYDVLSEIPGDKSYDLDSSLLKDIKSYTKTEIDLYKEGEGFSKEFLEKHPKVKALDSALTGKAMKNGLKVFDWSLFTAEEIAYLLSDYSVNISYLDILEEAFENQGILDNNMREAVNDLRNQYTDKFTEIILDVQNKLVDKAAGETLSKFVEIMTMVVEDTLKLPITTTDKITFSLGKFVWGEIFRYTGVTKTGSALKTFYGIYCYNGALDKEFDDAVNAAKDNGDLSHIKALINLQTATKLTAIDSIANTANWFEKKEERKAADELKNELNDWTYYVWDKHDVMTWLQQ